MFFAYWSHADDLAIEQFDSFGRGKDSRFGEFIILGDREFSQLGLKNGGHEVGCQLLICWRLPYEARRECECCQRRQFMEVAEKSESVAERADILPIAFG